MTIRSNMSQTLKVKKLRSAATLPETIRPGDAGFDLSLTEDTTFQPHERRKIALGLAVELPAGTVGLFWDRSSKANDGLKSMGGVIDESYRGELFSVLLNTNDHPLSYKAGTAIVQMLVQPVLKPEIEEIGDLSETDRGTAGFGSTDSK